ncbi:MAG: PKD domain-containing protein [Gillisia sp.]
MKNFTTAAFLGKGKKIPKGPEKFEVETWKSLLAFVLVFLFFGSIDLVAQNLPPASDCTSKDLEVVDAFLEMEDPCFQCGDENTESFPLTLSIYNKTGSFRPTFAFWGILNVYEDGELVSSTPISGCNDTKGLEAGLTTPVTFTNILYECGTTLELTDLTLAWTDASPVKNSSSKNSCENLTTKTVSSTGYLDIAPKCGTLPSLEIRTPIVAFAGLDDAACYDGGENSISLDGSASGGTPPYSYSWSGTGSNYLSASNIANPTFDDAEVGTYTLTLTVTDAKGCTDTNMVNLKIFANPTATAGNAGPVCYDATSIGLSETGGDAVSWSWSSDGSATFDDNTLQNPTASNFVDGEKFTVTITDANGCTSSADTTIQVDPEPTATAGNAGPVCYDATSIGLSETGGDAVSWSWSSDGSATFDDNTLQNPTASNFVDGEKFTVTITDANGCTSSADTTIQVNSLPTANAGADATLSCDGSAYQLDGSGSTGEGELTYSWTTLDGNIVSGPATATPSVDQPGTYTLTVTDENGCSDSDDVVITGPTNCNHLFPTQTTCQMYRDNPAAYVLNEVCLTVSGGTITNGTPGVFFYYGDIVATATSNNYEVVIDQIVPAGMSPFSVVNAKNVWVWSMNCTSQKIRVNLNNTDPGDVRITFNAVAGQTYIISAKYDVKSLNGTAAPAGGTANYQFGIPGASGSYGTIAVTDCKAPPILSSEAEPVKALSSADIPIDDSSLNTVKNGFNVSPVPFRESLSVQYDFDYVSDATIQMFDMQGRLLSTQKEAKAYKGKITDLNVNFRVWPSQVYVIKVITDRDVFTKKIISDK